MYMQSLKPHRRSQPASIFFPKPQPATAGTPYPLLLTIHGGGFVLGDPTDNDGWNAAFASQHTAVVVALNYSKAPAHPYPTALHDLEALIRAVLADPELAPPRVSRERVALLGWSAGGNLALAAAQLPSVRAAVYAVVPVYPVADFSVPREVKARARQYKPVLGGFRARPLDYLFDMMPKFDWAYVCPGQDLRDPLLSPFYAAREALPKRVFMVGCEMDLLGSEAWRMVRRLAGREVPGQEVVIGREEVGVVGELFLGSERFCFEEKGTDGSSYKWLLVPDTVHGFDQRIEVVVQDPVLMEDARAKTKACIKMIGDWLYSDE